MDRLASLQRQSPDDRSQAATGRSGAAREERLSISLLNAYQTVLAQPGAHRAASPRGDESLRLVLHKTGVHRLLQFDPTRVPLFAGLSRVTLARLAPHLEATAYGTGSIVEAPDVGQVHLVVEGEIAAEQGESTQIMPICTLGRGDLIQAPVNGADAIRYHCLTPVELVHVERKRLEQLAKEHPSVANRMHAQLTQRFNVTQAELMQARRLLARYSPEAAQQASRPVGDLPESPRQRERAELGAPKPSAKPAREPWLQRRTWVGLLINAAVILAMWLAIPNGAHPAYYLLAIFVWAGLNWGMATLPDHVVALAAAFSCVVLGIASFETAFAGFASGSWWMIVAVLSLVEVVSRSGLVYRLALSMLKILPPSYRSQSIALTLTGLATTPLLPSLNSRMAIVGPLASELSDAMRLTPKSKASAGLAMATYFGSAQSFFLFLNGAQTSILLWGVLAPDVRQQVTWGFWFVAALPMAVVLLAGILTILFAWYAPRNAEPIPHSRIELQQAVLGRMTGEEWVLVGLLGLLLVGFITEPWTGISATWPAVAIFLVLMGTGLLNKTGLKQIDWNLALYLAAVISLSTVATKIGFNEMLTNILEPWVLRWQLAPTNFLIGVAVLTILFRLVAPPAVVTVVLAVALEPVARLLAVSPFVAGLVVVAFCSSWFVPQQWSVYVSLAEVTKGRCFTHEQVKPLAWANNILLMLGLLASIPLWRWLGLMPA